MKIGERVFSPFLPWQDSGKSGLLYFQYVSYPFKRQIYLHVLHVRGVLCTCNCRVFALFSHERFKNIFINKTDIES